MGEGVSRPLLCFKSVFITGYDIRGEQMLILCPSPWLHWKCTFVKWYGIYDTKTGFQCIAKKYGEVFCYRFSQ